MINELKSTFVQKIQKAIDKMINGYYVDLCNFIDEIFYINSLTFCGMESSIPGEPEIVCEDTTTTTTTTTSTTTTSTTTTTTTTTLPPLNCLFNGGSAIEWSYS